MKLTIGNKLYTGFGLVILMVVLFSLYIINTFTRINQDLKIYDKLQNQVQIAKNIQNGVSQAAFLRLDASINRDQETVDKKIKPIAQDIKAKLEELLVINNGNSDSTARINKIKDDLAQFIVAGGRMFEAFKRSDKEGNDIKRNEYMPGAERLIAGTENSVKILDAKSEEASKAILAMAANAIRVAIIVMIIVITVSLGVAFYTTRNITGPLALVMGVAQKIAQGDLSNRDIVVANKDEIGELSNVFNKMSDNLNSLISRVAQASTQLASASSEFAATAEEMASGAEEQTSQTTQVASSMQEMSSTVEQVAKNSGTAATKAKSAGDTANVGGTVVSDTVAGMNRIANAVRELQQVILGLSNNSEKIGNIVGVIDDVADQTNLLALNAAIEAARAGEQGRGFAVVADEVRKLAERTSASTKEIATMVKSIQGDTTRAVSSMDQSAKEVDSGVQKANQAGESLKEIVTAAKSVQEMVQQIATAAEQQSAAAAEISSNIESIASVSKQNASAAQQTSTASQELSSLTEELEKVVGAFKLRDEVEKVQHTKRNLTRQTDTQFHPQFGAAHSNSHPKETQVPKKTAHKETDAGESTQING